MAEADAEPIPRASVFEGTNPVVEGGNSFAPFEGVVTGVNVRLKSFSEGNSEQVGQNVFGNRDGVFPSGLDVNPDVVREVRKAPASQKSSPMMITSSQRTLRSTIGGQDLMVMMLLSHSGCLRTK